MQYLPINEDDVLYYLSECEEWGYDESSTYDYVADMITDNLYNNHGILNVRKYRSNFKSLAHDLNNGKSFTPIEILQ
jgi:hypothetical protein